MALFTIRVRAYERALIFRNGDFSRVAGPGRYRLWSRLRPGIREVAEIYNTLEPRFEHELLPYLCSEVDVQKELEIADLGDDERGIVHIDGRMSEIIGPGLHAFWRGGRKVEIERFDATVLRLEDPRIDQIRALPNASTFLRGVDVDPHEVVVLTRNGEPAEMLGPGRHLFWAGRGKVSWSAVDLREQTLDVAGQEIMTQDKVGLRLNLVVQYVVTSPEIALARSTDYAASLYREAQLALRAAVGTRTLDALLADKASVGDELRAALESRATDLGLELRSVGLRDIVLPGEMREILNQVVLAERQAQANLIRRREETAAARSRANTAKLLSANPILARLEELEVVKDILAGTNATFVVGQGDLTKEIRDALRVDLGNTN